MWLLAQLLQRQRRSFFPDSARSGAFSPQGMLLHHAVSLRRIARIPRLIRKMLGNFFKGTVTKKLVHQRNHRGEGQPANFVEAIRLYRLAQSQDNVQARKMLWRRTARWPGRRCAAQPTPLFDLLPPSWPNLAPGKLKNNALHRIQIP
ncbi:hypothetical protein LP414_31505 [Polaromonas sp. P1(28)-13]|nr:hypothetical protein LP414_31505 [Polaromonas sp. P1(28)-13]